MYRDIELREQPYSLHCSKMRSNKRLQLFCINHSKSFRTLSPSPVGEGRDEGKNRMQELLEPLIEEPIVRFFRTMKPSIQQRSSDQSNAQVIIAFVGHLLPPILAVLAY